MGCSESQLSDPHAKRVDALLREEDKLMKNTVHCLLLGAGDSGKSTFIRQIAHHHGRRITPVQELTMKAAIDGLYLIRLRLTIEDMVLSQLQAMTRKLKNDKKLPKELEKAAKVVLESNLGELSQLVPHIQKLWEHEVLKELFVKREDLSLASCLDYYLDKIETIMDPNYVLSHEDIVRCRMKTVGIQHMEVEDSGKKWVFCDVGGQRNQRRKWIHVFDNVSAVCYVSALDQYDMVLEEDGECNRFRDDLELFGELVCTPYLPSRTWIFFQNKVDLLEKKLSRSPLSDYFEDIPKDRECDLDFVLEYFRGLFTSKLKETHIPEKVYDSIRESIIGGQFNAVGL